MLSSTAFAAFFHIVFEPYEFSLDIDFRDGEQNVTAFWVAVFGLAYGIGLPAVEALKEGFQRWKICVNVCIAAKIQRVRYRSIKLRCFRPEAGLQLFAVILLIEWIFLVYLQQSVPQQAAFSAGFSAYTVML